jgi:hypothetical protein
LSGILKRFVDSLRDLFSSQGKKDPLTDMSDIEPSTFNDSLATDEEVYLLGTNTEIEQEVET